MATTLGTHLRKAVCTANIRRIAFAATPSTQQIPIAQKMEHATAEPAVRSLHANTGDKMPKPSLAIGIICKNESRDLPRALASVRTIADYIYVIDTGSTDDTVAIAKRSGCKVRRFTKASEKSADGQWLLWDFSAARNHVIEWAETSGATHYMWVDADDVVITPLTVVETV